MNNDKVNEVLEKYIKLLGEVGYESKRSEAQVNQTGDLYADQREIAGHAMWMCTEAFSWPAERIEKKFRWLGFVQGALWSCGLRTIEELKQDNMPDEEKPLREHIVRVLFDNGLEAHASFQASSEIHAQNLAHSWFVSGWVNQASEQGVNASGATSYDIVGVEVPS